MRILHSKKLVFVSKPRCGSTSIRRILDSFLAEDDIYCDYANQFIGLHPHMTAPAIYSFLNENGFNAEEYTFFTVTRNPIDMLWSYYKFFQPDINCKYNWEKQSENTLSFIDWLLSGKVGLGKTWADYVPPYITQNDLSPLSLDAHVLDNNSINYCENVFQMENRKPLVDFLSSHLDSHINDLKVNSSHSKEIPKISREVLTHIEKMFSMDYDMYRKELENLY